MILRCLRNSPLRLALLLTLLALAVALAAAGPRIARALVAGAPAQVDAQAPPAPPEDQEPAAAPASAKGFLAPEPDAAETGPPPELSAASARVAAQPRRVASRSSSSLPVQAPTLAPAPTPTPAPAPAPAAPPPAPPPPAPPASGSSTLTAAKFVVPSGVVLHRVAQGETLSAIAAKQGTSVNALRQTNLLNSDILMVAQPLFARPGSNARETISLTQGPRGPGGAELLTWEQARWVFSVGRDATIHDPESGLKLRVRYMGGSNHADCEPITADDTATLRRIAGGSWTWNPKPVHVTIGDRTIAASINFMPHGVQTNGSNGLAGHFCMHFWRSRGHASGVEDPRHQANVLRAANLERSQLPAGA